MLTKKYSNFIVISENGLDITFCDMLANHKSVVIANVQAFSTLKETVDFISDNYALYSKVATSILMDETIPDFGNIAEFLDVLDPIAQDGIRIYLITANRQRITHSTLPAKNLSFSIFEKPLTSEMINTIINTC